MAINITLDESSLVSLRRTWNDHSLYPYAHLKTLCKGGIDAGRARQLQDMLEECRRRCDLERAETRSFMSDWNDQWGNIIARKRPTTAEEGFGLIEAIIHLRANYYNNQEFMIGEITRSIAGICDNLTNPKAILYLHAARLVVLDIAPDVDKAVEKVLASAKVIDPPSSSELGSGGR